MPDYRGLTWDHPRGRHALEAAARATTDAAGQPLIEWDVHSLEGFESAPIGELAERYDVIVLDHPHLGDALAAEAIRPIEDLYQRDFVARLRADAVGPSAASYTVDDRLWALPLDAATQVAVSAPERVDVAPDTWHDVLALAESEPVALSLAGPHALLTFQSVCVALGAADGVEPRTIPGRGIVDADLGEAAFDLLATLARGIPPETATLNPIGLLERMRRQRDLAYIPLVYGYVNYASGIGALRFDDAPAATPGGRRGSTIGGTGIAITTRRTPSRDLLAHLAALLSSRAQTGFIPEHDGQPSLREAWESAEVNAASGDFYRRTLATIEQSWVRPRVAGYTPFQSEASALLRDALLDRTSPSAAVAAVNARFDALASTPERSRP
ncbi:multiple sugar transport system substrate-binding protein [Agromyces terreus]|uniref:Multiple sugar transport system substrate-binding protein n=1 Tax=Agromyces terreus TaxID=424795 RepID=A0A9X2KB26_9MICO|nr:carbohydrate ABC transporter substrate-binding protein [Agromyces terreus]MCP2369715.1 multiple sugar transport system substrate-binding protein [Agromyces terreus]